MIAGLVEPTAGRISLDGRDITREKPNHRGLGVVFQSYALFPHMTVAQNVAFGLEMRRVPSAERMERVREALSLVQLTSFVDRYPRQLSGGQRQRVARALVIAPPVLLLDEPLSNLDAKLREEMQFELRRIQRKVGTTTIMVTHDQAEALSISDRVVVMEGGRMTQVDAPYRLYEQPSNAFISSFVGKTNLLAGTWRRNGASSAVDIGGVLLEASAPEIAAGMPVTLSIRPEKILMRDAGAGRLEGRVASRFFLGSQWLFTIDTPIGNMIVSTPNQGVEPPAEGSPVGLDWSPANLRIIAGTAAAAA
jgi:putative spermidine/putrescine transport system ATP-binding protein